MQEKKDYSTTGNTFAAQKVILLVDDDEDEHEIFQSALDNVANNVRFISANGCDEALGMLEELNPDFIFIDVNMPRTNGMICLEGIRKIQRIAHVPVYMYSTGMSAKDGQKARQLGAVDYIIKPASIASLSNLLRNILDANLPLN